MVKTDTLAIALNTIWTPRALNELRVQIGRDAEPGTVNSDLPEASIRESQTVLWIGQNSFGPRDTRLRKYQVLDNVSVLRGRHHWKFGADVNLDRVMNYAPTSFGGSYTFESIADFLNNRASTYTQAFAGPGTRGPRTRPNSADVSWFMQDNFHLGPHLTLNAGLRYDVQILAQPAVFNSDSQLAVAGIRTDRVPVDKNNFGPRVGFAWRPRDSDLFVVRGGYGIYYGRTPTMLLAQAHAQNGLNVNLITWSADRVTLPAYPTRFVTPPAGGVASTNLYFFHRDFRSPYVQQGNLGAEFGLGRNMSISANYLFTKGTHLTRTVDVNLFPPAPATIAIAGGGSLPYLRYSDDRPYDHFGWLNQFTSNANSVYHGLALQWNRRFQALQFLASYTLSKVIDDVPDATAALVSTPGDRSKFVQYTFLPQLDRGPGATDQRHRFVFSGVWDPSSNSGLSTGRLRGLFKGLSLAWVFTAASGRPYSGMVQGDLNNDDNAFNDRAPLEGRNIYTSPKFVSFDPRAIWQIPLHEKFRLQFIVEAFNLFNRPNYGPFNELGVAINSMKYTLNPARTLLTPGSDFGRPRETFDPRILQLAVRLHF